MDYDELIDSITSAILEEMGYKQRSEEENRFFSFEGWWETSGVKNCIHETVDAYVTSEDNKYHLELILHAKTSIKELDEGLYAHCDSWIDSAAYIAFELLKKDVREVVATHVAFNAPGYEAGGVFPQTNDKQMWFGKWDGAPTFSFLPEEKLPSFVDLTRRKRSVILHIMDIAYLLFEGEAYEGEAQDFAQLVLGSHWWVTPRRVATLRGSKEVQTVQRSLALAISEEWVSIVKHGNKNSKTLLSELPFGELKIDRVRSSKF
jgi:hypothetical protein